MTLYDVCNDYSLDPAADQIIPPADVYQVSYHYCGGLVFTHKEYNEIYYFLGKDGLTGEFLGAIDEQDN